MIHQPPTRREAIERCISRGLLVAVAPMASSRLFSLWGETVDKAHQPTSTEVLGPFFKKSAPNQSAMRATGDPGIPLHVSGKILNTRGDAVPGAQIDVWQADHQGHYDLRGYRYRAKLALQQLTEYSIETVMPGHYEDRPAQHIHYMISAPGHKTLITQLYFATDPFFEGDPGKNFHKRSIVGNPELIRPVMLFEQPGTAHTSVTFDLCLEKA